MSLLTATSDRGVAYLDLPGNRIVWNVADTSHDHIILDGSQFHDVVPMATLAISALCLLSFFTITMAVCCVCCCSRHASRYFALDIANRVFHERQMKFPTAYIGIDVAMGSLPSLADGLLMLYLKAYSPVDTECAGPFVTIAMIFAFVFYWLSSVAAKGTQIWSLIAQKATGTGNGGFKSSGGYSNLAAKALRIYRDVYSAATGMHLLFAISFALASVAFLRQRSKNQTLHNGPYLAIAILAASFLVRGVFDFVITFIYRQNGYVSLIIQLIFMATYGILSVVIYACIVSMAAAQKKQNALPGKVKPNEAAQTLFSEGVDTWERTAGLQSQGL